MIAAVLALALASAAAVAPTLPPVVYQAQTKDYDARLRIAPELKAVPGAYAPLKAKAVADLETFETSAVKDMARLRREEPTSVMARTPEVARIEVDLVVRTPHLLALIERDYLDAHGAHSAYWISGLIYDLGSGRRLSASDLVRPDADMSALNGALARAVHAAKAARGDPVKPDDSFVKAADLTWAGGADLMARHDLFVATQANKASDLPVLATLTASNVPDRAGRLQFLYSPYDIGPFVDGAFRIVLPWRVFAADLKPQYRVDFASAPAGDLAADPLSAFPADVPPAPPLIPERFCVGGGLPRVAFLKIARYGVEQPRRAVRGRDIDRARDGAGHGSR